jgi:hypothetical protein
VMSNDVFANGREIACKKADGKSICAFPDVCFTPPQTPATPPGVPIPYPNTAYAKDTTKGSKTVKISGNEVMLKNKSYFKKSTGDEAGNAPKKGVVTSKITGKVYFTSWSPNVKFEGKNVVRHLDLTTHNHGSDPANEGAPWPYVDSAIGIDKKKECNHEWEIRPPEGKYTVEQKKERLRKGELGDKFEAYAAEHNKVTDGDNMSGKNKQSKLYQHCKKCGIQGNEVDHIERDNSGKITSIVECKSGNCNIKAAQLEQGNVVAKQIGATLKYKLEKGSGAEKAKKYLLDNGFSEGNILII